MAQWAPNRLHARLFVGRDEEMPGTTPRVEGKGRVAYLSVDDSQRAVREFSGAPIPAWWGRDRVADQLLSVLPPMSPTGDDPAYQQVLRELLEQHRAAGSLPLTEEDEA